ncbi:MAG: saccharopine dehydrogenase [Propionibacteriales bacterium]|nr:saccharopine dehydrogenase [Propionibacteriales bacterium]
MTDGRTHDVVLFGATGFTGGLTAEYLARHAAAGARLALAGRHQGRLEAVRRRLAAINPACAELPLLYADVTNPDSMSAMAAATRVVITTVGPYVRYGEPVVAACAEHGTDYVDLTGEPEFVDRTYLRHHERATQTGARLVHACGFESIPYDLGGLFTVRALPRGVPIRLDAFMRARGDVSGGTFQSAVTGFSRPRQNVQAHKERRRVEPLPDGRRVRAVSGRPGRRRDLGAWAIPLPTLDPQIVARSAAALEVYGPDFTYRQYAAVRRLTTVAGLGSGLAAVLVAAQVPPIRRRLLNRRAPGAGPSEEKRARSWFTVRFVGEGGGERVVTEVAGGDPGYTETAKMLAESALCLAFDDLPESSGQVTTAAAMGDALIRRLRAAGIGFRVLEGAERTTPIGRRT